MDDIVEKFPPGVQRRLDRKLVPKPAVFGIATQAFSDFFDKAETWLDVEASGGNTLKQCYQNALDFYLQNPSTYKIYVGYGIKDYGGGFKFHTDHAWCVDGDKVIDTTWKEEQASYVGVPVADVNAYAAAIKERGFGVSLIMAAHKDRQQMFGF